jgi:hypothetical protein
MRAQGAVESQDSWCGHAPRRAAEQPTARRLPVECGRNRSLPQHHRAKTCVHPLKVPRNGRQAEPLPAKPRAAPAASGPGRSPLSGLPLGAPAHGSEGPRQPRASVRGFLARLIRRRGALRPTKDAEFDASERAAYRSALEFWGGPPLAPAPLKRSPRMPGPRSSSAPTTEPDDVADAARAERRSAWAAAPGSDAQETAQPGGVPEEGSRVLRRRLRPGETAPDSLLEAPASVRLAADDFFDGLIRQLEGDR